MSSKPTILSFLCTWKAFQTICTIVRKIVGGRPRKTTAMNNRYIVLQAKRARYKSESTIAQQLYTVTGARITAVYCGQTPSQRWPIRPLS
ncbi:hypothetical protein TNCV_3949081 [Trichonephila clavipes]|nr:hypothetical protein TNCV_3949081 [Trichonephila clavipes]